MLWHVDIEAPSGNVIKLDFTSDSAFFAWMRKHVAEVIWMGGDGLPADYFEVTMNTGWSGGFWPHYAALGKGRYY